MRVNKQSLTNFSEGIFFFSWVQMKHSGIRIAGYTNLIWSDCIYSSSWPTYCINTDLCVTVFVYISQMCTVQTPTGYPAFHAKKKKKTVQKESQIYLDEFLVVWT